ncbi:tetratricopeptide repeat protein [Cellvibrio fontiphilus]|uniref:Tetratricopeptide repeat protein n=1 Tax=Cellvibrio fontiphilus TaxID=1815559 RepID=A0ABV7FIL6_9GAMM
MTFTKRATWVWLIAALSVLSACSSNAPKKATGKKTPAAEATLAAPGASILPAGPATPNPYLQNRPAVSRELNQQFADATRAMRNKQWGQAENLLQQIIQADPKLSGAHLNLGLVYRAQQENKRAEQAFNNALNANHTNLDAYNQLAILQREAGNFAAAENNYKKALSVWPYHPDSHKNIAILYDLYLGKSAEALPHFEAYLALTGGEDKQAKSWIADLQRRLGIAAKPKATEAAPAAAEGDSNE